MGEQGELLSSLSDEELEKGISENRIPKKSGVEELLSRHVPALYKFLLKRYSLEEAFVNDVVGETVLLILENYDRYDPGKGVFISWAFGIASNKIQEHFRRERRYVDLANVEADAEDAARDLSDIDTREIPLESIEYKEFEKSALQAVLDLPELDSLLFLLKTNYDLTYDELAQILSKTKLGEKGITADALAQRMSRLKKNLRDMLEPKR